MDLALFCRPLPSASASPSSSSPSSCPSSSPSTSSASVFASYGASLDLSPSSSASPSPSPCSSSSSASPFFFFRPCNALLDSLASSASPGISLSASLRRRRVSQPHRPWRCSPPAAALMENPVPAKHDLYTVGEFMTKLKDLYVVKSSTTVDEALELLVRNRVTGLPVVDDAGKLVGVVSDFDLLALDSISGKTVSNSSLFPEPDSTWKAFKELQKLINKTHGKIVGEVMTPSPLVVREMTNLEDAARLLLETKYRRLPVVDDSGKLVGLLTRGNVIRAALKIRKEN